MKMLTRALSWKSTVEAQRLLMVLSISVLFSSTVLIFKKGLVDVRTENTADGSKTAWQAKALGRGGGLKKTLPWPSSFSLKRSINSTNRLPFCTNHKGNGTYLFWKVQVRFVLKCVLSRFLYCSIGIWPQIIRKHCGCRRDVEMNLSSPLTLHYPGWD